MDLVDLTPVAAGRGKKPLGAAHSPLPISQGKPQPQAMRTHDGCALDASHVSMRNEERDSNLFIREAQCADLGHYQLHVQLGGLEATATTDTLVIGTVGGMGDDVVLGGSHPSLKRNQHREPGKRGCGTQWWVKGGVAEQKRRGPSW